VRRRSVGQEKKFDQRTHLGLFLSGMVNKDGCMGTSVDARSFMEICRIESPLPLIG
jgi:hypothetical protein